MSFFNSIYIFLSNEYLSPFPIHVIYRIYIEKRKKIFIPIMFHKAPSKKDAAQNHEKLTSLPLVRKMPALTINFVRKNKAFKSSASLYSTQEKAINQFIFHSSTWELMKYIIRLSKATYTFIWFHVFFQKLLHSI